MRNPITEPLDQLLREDLHRLTDRLATCGAGGPVPRAETHARLAEAERRLTQLRHALLERYAEWRLALDACEDLAVVAGLKADSPVHIDRWAA